MPYPSTEATIILQLSSHEATRLLSYNQRVPLLDQIARAIADGLTPTITMRAEVSLADLLRTFETDGEEAPASAAALSLPGNATRRDIAIAARAHLKI